jgi:hypothetical protein
LASYGQEITKNRKVERQEFREITERGPKRFVLDGMKRNKYRI